jgi:hydroxymethylpyrimidine pyrophosphatase-like HAD family hydrolase
VGLIKLAELLGVPLWRTIAVGDYYNDVSMLEQAGLSFAVANAVDAAKAAARYTTVSNNDHAIAAIVEGLDSGAFVL